jgi:hypothetical protein
VSSVSINVKNFCFYMKTILTKYMIFKLSFCCELMHVFFHPPKFSLEALLEYINEESELRTALQRF